MSSIFTVRCLFRCYYCRSNRQFFFHWLYCLFLLLLMIMWCLFFLLMLLTLLRARACARCCCLFVIIEDHPIWKQQKGVSTTWHRSGLWRTTGNIIVCHMVWQQIFTQARATRPGWRTPYSNHSSSSEYRTHGSRIDGSRTDGVCVAVVLTENQRISAYNM